MRFSKLRSLDIVPLSHPPPNEHNCRLNKTNGRAGQECESDHVAVPITAAASAAAARIPLLYRNIYNI